MTTPDRSLEQTLDTIRFLARNTAERAMKDAYPVLLELLAHEQPRISGEARAQAVREVAVACGVLR